MPRIREYNSQVSPQGQIGGRAASAEDFGAGIGRAVEGIGQTLGVMSERIQKAEEMREVSDAGKRIAENELYWTEETQRRAKELTPGDRSYAPSLKEDIQKQFTSLGEGYKTQKAKDYVSQQGLNMATRYVGHALGVQQQLAVEAQKQNVNDVQKAWGSILAEQPERYEEYKKNLEIYINSVYAEDVRQPEKQKLLSDFTSQNAHYTLMALATKPASAKVLLRAIDPELSQQVQEQNPHKSTFDFSVTSKEEVLKQINKIPDQNEKADALKQFYAQTEPATIKTELPKDAGALIDQFPAWKDASAATKLAVYEKAQTEAAREKRLAANNLKSAQEDHFSEAIVTGGIKTRLSLQQFKDAYGSDGAGAYLTYTANIDAAIKANTIVDQTPAVQQKMIDAMTPSPGEGYADAIKRQDMVRNAAKQGNEKFLKDPLEFQQQRGQTQLTLLKDANPTNVGVELASRSPQVEDNRQRTNGERVWLTAAERDIQSRAFVNMSDVEQLSYIDGIDSSLKRRDLTASYFKEISKDNLAPMTAAIWSGMNKSTAYGGTTYTSKDIARLGLIGNNAMNTKDKSEDGSGKLVTSLLQEENKLKEQFFATLGTAQIGLGADMNQLYDQVRNVYVGDQIVSGKLTGKYNEESATKAIELVAGTPSQIGQSQVLRPFGVTDKAFREEMHQRFNNAGLAGAWDEYEYKVLKDGQYAVSLNGIPKTYFDMSEPLPKYKSRVQAKPDLSKPITNKPYDPIGNVIGGSIGDVTSKALDDLSKSSGKRNLKEPPLTITFPKFKEYPSEEE